MKKNALTIAAVLLLLVLIVALLYLPYPGRGGSKILRDVPDVAQSTNYTCGPAALEAVMSYRGIDESEGRLAALSGTRPDNGTIPENILATALEYGLRADSERDMTRAGLQRYIDNGTPVIVLAQAWRNNTSVSWPEDWYDGHYMVAIGYNGSAVYLEDPAILGSRGYIPWGEFMDRWHDMRYNLATGREERYTHLGLIITGHRPVVQPAFTPVE